jgi:hypothetical protein
VVVCRLLPTDIFFGRVYFADRPGLGPQSVLFFFHKVLVILFVKARFLQESLLAGVDCASEGVAKRRQGFKDNCRDAFHGLRFTIFMSVRF